MRPIRALKSERGQTLVMTAVSLTALLGFAGLATDVGVMFRAQRQLQIGADAGATAAAMATSYGQSASTAAAAAQTAAINNGWAGATLTQNSNPPTSTTSLSAPQVTVNMPPLAGYHESAGYVEVYVTEPNPTFFMKMFGFGSMNVSARAVAGSPGSGANCIYLLDPTDYDLKMQGSSTINATNCGIYDNSSNTDSILTIGGSQTVNAPYIDTVGGDGNGTYAPNGTTTYTNSPPESDPLPPQETKTPASCGTTVASLPTGTTINAGGGVYCVTGNNPSIDGKTLENGTFVFENGVTAGTTAIGTSTLPATLVISGGSFTQNNGNFSLVAPTTGTYDGVGLLVPTTNTSYNSTPCASSNPGNGNTNGMLQVQFGSSNQYNLDGLIVAPGAGVYLQDNGGVVATTGIVGACLFIKSSTIDVSSYNKAHPNSTPIRTFSLVE